MEVKFLSGISFNIVMEVVIGEVEYKTTWQKPGDTWEVISTPINGEKYSSGFSEVEIKALISGFKEAKAVFAKEIEQLEGLVNPFMEYIKTKG